jgi:hypothetical protein
MDVERIAKTIAINGISYLVLNSLPLPIISSRTCSSSILGFSFCNGHATKRIFQQGCPILPIYVQFLKEFYAICIQKFCHAKPMDAINAAN